MSDSLRSLVVYVEGSQYVKKIIARKKREEEEEEEEEEKKKKKKKKKRKKKNRGYGILVQGAYLGTDVLVGQGDSHITGETIIYSELVACDVQQPHSNASSR